jgi:hypothetical protein
LYMHMYMCMCMYNRTRAEARADGGSCQWRELAQARVHVLPAYELGR